MWARFHVNSQVKERTLTLQHAHAHTCTCACISCEQERRVHIHTCKHTPAFVLHWILFDTGREKHCQSVVKLSAQQLFSTWLLTLHMKPLTHMHTANLVWSVLPLTVSHRSSCRAERKFVLQVYSGRRYFVFWLCSCLHCSGVCHCGLFAHDKGARMLKKHLYPLLSIILYGSTWLSYMTEECIVCVRGRWVCHWACICTQRQQQQLKLMLRSGACDMKQDKRVYLWYTLLHKLWTHS